MATPVQEKLKMAENCSISYAFWVTSGRASDFLQDERSGRIIGIELERVEKGPLRLDVEYKVRQGENGGPNCVVFQRQSVCRFRPIVAQKCPQVGHGNPGISEGVTNDERNQEGWKYNHSHCGNWAAAQRDDSVTFISC